MELASTYHASPTVQVEYVCSAQLSAQIDLDLIRCIWVIRCTSGLSAQIISMVNDSTALQGAQFPFWQADERDQGDLPAEEMSSTTLS